MLSSRFLKWTTFGVLVLGTVAGCGGSSDTPKKSPEVAEAPAQPFPVTPAPQPKVEPTIPPITIPELPVIPVDRPPPMPPPAPLPPDEPSGPGPMVVVQPNPNPNPPPPVGPETIVPPAPDPNAPAKKPTFPKFIAGRDLKEWIQEAVAHKDPQYREAALRVLPLFGPDARKEIIHPLCEMIRNQATDPSIRIAAITIVSNLGFDFRINDNTATPEEKKKMHDLRVQSREVVGALRAVMADTLPGSTLRMYCAQSLATFGADAHPAVGGPNSVGTLRSLSIDSSWATRHAVAQTLGLVGVPAEKDGKPDPEGSPYEPATDILLNILLKDKCAAVRVAAVQSLLMLGPPKVKNIADYAKAVKKFVEPVALRVEPSTPNGKIAEDDHGVLVWLWLLQLSYDDRKEADNIKKICHQVKQPKEPGVRLQALYALTALGTRAAPAIPTLREALDNYDDPIIVAATLTAIAAVGPKGGADAIPEITKVKNGSKDPKKPDDADKNWKPDQTLRYLAEDCLNVVTGKKKLVELKEEKDKKDDKK